MTLSMKERVYRYTSSTELDELLKLLLRTGALCILIWLTIMGNYFE